MYNYYCIVSRRGKVGEKSDWAGCIRTGESRGTRGWYGLMRAVFLLDEYLAIGVQREFSVENTVCVGLGRGDFS